MSRYTLTRRAKVDIQLIWNRIAEDSMDAADRVKDELRSAMQMLSRMPGMGHRRPDVKNPRYRFWSVYSYLIAYFPDTKPLQIVRVVHGAQNLRGSFGNSERKRPPWETFRIPRQGGRANLG